MSRKRAADYTDVLRDQYRLVYLNLIGAFRLLCSALSVIAFNNVVYQNGSFLTPSQSRSNGDQVALFYCKGTLDQSESSMLVSAGFESHRPVNS